MLWEHNSTIIVMLSKLREMGREKCHQYWPSERSARYQYFVVDPMAEYNMPQYILREFKVTDARVSSILCEFKVTYVHSQPMSACKSTKGAHTVDACIYYTFELISIVHVHCM